MAIAIAIVEVARTSQELCDAHGIEIFNIDADTSPDVLRSELVTYYRSKLVPDFDPLRTLVRSFRLQHLLQNRPARPQRAPKRISTLWWMEASRCSLRLHASRRQTSISSHWYFSVVA